MRTLLAVHFAVGNHRAIDRLIQRARIRRAAFHGLRGGGMAAGVANLHVVIGIDAGLLQLVERNQVAAGGVDVAKREALALAVGQLVNRRARLRDEQRMEILVGAALHQRSTL